MVNDTNTEQARELVAKLDTYIAVAKEAQMWPPDGREGEAYLVELVAQALQAARDEERERCAGIVLDESRCADNCSWPGNPDMRLTVQAWLLNVRARIRAQAPRPDGTINPPHGTIAPTIASAAVPPPTSDPSETIPERVQNAAKAESYTPAGIDSEYARGVRAAAVLCESEADRNREAERHVPALTYRVAARQILALLPAEPGISSQADASNAADKGGYNAKRD